LKRNSGNGLEGRINMGFLIGLLLGVFLGFYAGNLTFRHKVNAGIGSGVRKAINSIGSDAKKKKSTKKESK
jgi:hypothetical protein